PRLYYFDSRGPYAIPFHHPDSLLPNCYGCGGGPPPEGRSADVNAGWKTVSRLAGPDGLHENLSCQPKPPSGFGHKSRDRSTSLPYHRSCRAAGKARGTRLGPLRHLPGTSTSPFFRGRGGPDDRLRGRAWR